MMEEVFLYLFANIDVISCCSFQVTKCFFEDSFHDTNVYVLEELAFGHSIEGPALIIDKNR